MRTVIHTIIDGNDIVLGFADPVIDPVATSIKIEELLKSLPEVKANQDLNNQIMTLNRKAAMLPRNARSQYKIIAADIEKLQTQVGKNLMAIDVRRRQMVLDNPVWCNPGNAISPDGATVYESLMPETDSEYNDGKTGHIVASTLKSAIDSQGPNEATKMDGKHIADYRGLVVWLQGKSGWTSRNIVSLGDAPKGKEILEPNLTETHRSQIIGQMEEERISKLSDDEKVAEAKSTQSMAKQRVTSIQAEVTAGITDQKELSSAISEYKSELAGINDKYGTSLK